jgi:hypothetical protein
MGEAGEPFKNWLNATLWRRQPLGRRQLSTSGRLTRFIGSTRDIHTEGEGIDGLNLGM